MYKQAEITHNHFGQTSVITNRSRWLRALQAEENKGGRNTEMEVRGAGSSPLRGSTRCPALGDMLLEPSCLPCWTQETSDATKDFLHVNPIFVSRTRNHSAELLSITPEGSMDREELKSNPWGSDPPF